MKKLFVVAFAVAVLMVAAPNKAEAAYSDGAALGAGVGFSTYAGSGGVAVNFGNIYATGKFAGIDPVFGLDFGFSSSMLILSADWWLLNPKLGQVGAADVSLYLGPGVGVGIRVANNPFRLNLSARLPIGFSWVVAKNWEIFTEILVSLHVLSLQDYHNVKDDTVVSLFGVNLNNGGWELGNALSAGLNVGFRYWF